MGQCARTHDPFYYTPTDLCVVQSPLGWFLPHRQTIEARRRCGKTVGVPRQQKIHVGKIA